MHVGVNQAEPLSLTFVGRNLREAEQNLDFDLGGPSITGVDGTGSRNLASSDK